MDLEEKVRSGGPLLSFAGYMPKEGQEDALLALVGKHVETLRSLGFVSDKTNYVAKAEDGRIVEVFEWVSGNAVNAAHQHPAIADIWEKMALVADFPPMNTLPEANQPFASFKML